MVDQEMTQNKAKTMIEFSGILLAIIAGAIATQENVTDLTKTLYYITAIILMTCAITGISILFEIPVTKKVKENAEIIIKSVGGIFIIGLTAATSTISTLFIKSTLEVSIFMIIAPFIILFIMSVLTKEEKEKKTLPLAKKKD